MTAYAGKEFILKLEDPDNLGSFITIGGGKSCSVSISGSVQTTSDFIGQVSELAIPGTKQTTTTISAGGVFVDSDAEQIVFDLKFSGEPWQFKVMMADLRELTGYFYVTSFSRSGDMSGAEGYSISLQGDDILESAIRQTYTTLCKSLDCMSYWKLDETTISGSVVFADEMGVNDGTGEIVSGDSVAGIVTDSAGARYNAADVRLTNATTYIADGTPITIVFWVKTDENSYRTMLDIRSAGGTALRVVILGRATLTETVMLSDNGTLVSRMNVKTSTFPQDQVKMLAITYNGSAIASRSNWTCYINASPHSLQTPSLTGYTEPSQNLNGIYAAASTTIDEVSYHSRVLTQDEISALYLAGTS